VAPPSLSQIQLGLGLPCWPQETGELLFGCVETLKVYIIDLIALAYSISASACRWRAHDISFDEHST
jgi:hypothetical protein